MGCGDAARPEAIVTVSLYKLPGNRGVRLGYIGFLQKVKITLERRAAILRALIDTVFGIELTQRTGYKSDTYHQIGCLHAGVGLYIRSVRSHPGVRASGINDKIV